MVPVRPCLRPPYQATRFDNQGPDPPGVCRCLDARTFDYPHIHTPHGPMVVRIGDWVVYDERRVVTLSTAEDFELNYDLVPEGDA